MQKISQLDLSSLDKFIFSNPKLGGRLQQLFRKLRAEDGEEGAAFVDQESRKICGLEVLKSATNQS